MRPLKFRAGFEVVIPARISPNARRSLSRLKAASNSLAHLQACVDGGWDIDVDEHHLADLAEATEFLAGVIKRAKATTPRTV